MYSIRDLNRLRLYCLAFLLPCVALAFISLAFLFFAISPNVNLGFVFPFVMFLLFGTAFVFMLRMYRKKHTEYMKSYIANVRKIAFANEFDGCTVNKGHIPTEILEKLEIIRPREKVNFIETFSASYDDTPFESAYFETEGGFFGQIFIYTYDEKFKRNALIRQRGFITAGSGEYEGFEKYTTGNSMFDYAFTAMAQNQRDGQIMLIEPVLQEFLRFRLHASAKIMASFEGERLYIVLQNPKRHFDIPLFLGLEINSLKEAALSESRLVNTISSNLKIEKDIWRKYSSD